uniref:RING-type domain-containing protein n=1 Tax=Leersia perrieri TaxID=77586 RepID=A0A0D9XFD0_9ORYZ
MTFDLIGSPKSSVPNAAGHGGKLSHAPVPPSGVLKFLPKTVGPTCQSLIHDTLCPYCCASSKVSMSTVSGTRRAMRRQSQDGSADKVVVNLDAIPSPVVGSRRQVAISAGARASPIDVEALDDEVQTRRNRRTRRQPVAVVDLEVDASREGNKRQRVAPVIHCLSPERGEGSSLQSNKTSKEPPKVVPKEPVFNCPVCWNKLEEPSTTICGHIFCMTCIKQAIQIQKKCPTCRKSLRANNFHRTLDVPKELLAASSISNIIYSGSEILP